MENEDLQQTGDQEQAAAAPVETQSTPQPEQAKMVPLSALESEREKRQQREQELQLMKENLELMRAQKPVEEPKRAYDPSDVPTWGEVENFVAEREKRFKTSYEELRVAQKYKDYEEVVSKYLPEVIKEQPHLRDVLQNTQDYELAYYLAKKSDAYRSSASQQDKNDTAERIMRNTSQAGSLSSMGATAPVSQSKRYKDMSDQEFAKLAAKNLGY